MLDPADDRPKPAARRRRAPTGAARDRAPVDAAPLDAMVGYALRRAQLAVFKNFRTAFDAVEITPAQCSVLILIERHPGVTQSEISDALSIQRANLVTLIDTLERRGLAERTPAADRRSHALRLTAAGRQTMPLLHQANAAHEAQVAALLSQSERAALLDMLGRITAALDGAG
jgi:DNA-binding MarR family transcriptional regulator